MCSRGAGLGTSGLCPAHFTTQHGQCSCVDGFVFLSSDIKEPGSCSPVEEAGTALSQPTPAFPNALSLSICQTPVVLFLVTRKEQVACVLWMPTFFLPLTRLLERHAPPDCVQSSLSDNHHHHIICIFGTERREIRSVQWVNGWESRNDVLVLHHCNKIHAIISLKRVKVDFGSPLWSFPTSGPIVLGPVLRCPSRQEPVVEEATPRCSKREGQGQGPLAF